jgi:hypothetical protein
MAMEFLAFHNQLVADLATDNENNNLISEHQRRILPIF